MILPRRLDKFARESTRKSLVEVRELIASGAVVVKRDGVARNDLTEEALVFDSDTIVLCDEKLNPLTEHHTYLLNKPKNVTSTASDPQGKRDLRPWLRQMAPGTFPVGRLDRESTGALICTTDGDLSSAILRPDHVTPKLYWLWLNEHVSLDDPRLQTWHSGVPMLGAIGRALTIEIYAQTEHTTELHVTLGEGKNRQIRRMCYAADLRLLHLHRKAIGPIHLGRLALGEFQKIDEPAMSALWESVGGRLVVLKKQYRALERKAQQLREEGSPDLRLESWLADHPLGILRE